MSKKQMLLTAAISALAAAAIASGIAWAAIPDSAGVLHACYSPNGALGTNGTQLNIIDKASASCSKGQQEVTWSQQGPKGDKGERGIQGIPGANGTNGTNGADGVSVIGAVLNPGDASCPEGGSQFTAVNGVTYACNGKAGRDGTDGQDGAQGPPGPPGPQGAQGPPGPGSDMRWARVDAQSGLVAESANFGATPHIENASYVFDFDRDVSHCAAVVSAESNYTASAFHALGARVNRIFVQLNKGYDIFGSPSYVFGDFDLAVFC